MDVNALVNVDPQGGGGPRAPPGIMTALSYPTEGILTLLLQPTPGMFEKSNFVKHGFSGPPAKNHYQLCTSVIFDFCQRPRVFSDFLTQNSHHTHGILTYTFCAGQNPLGCPAVPPPGDPY